MKVRVLLPIPIGYYKSPINLGEHVGNGKLKLYGHDFREHSHILLKTSRNSPVCLAVCINNWPASTAQPERSAWLPFPARTKGRVEGVEREDHWFRIWAPVNPNHE